MDVVGLANEMDRPEVGILEQQQHRIVAVSETFEAIVQELDDGGFADASTWGEGATRAGFARLLAHEGVLQDSARTEMLVEEGLDLAILGIGCRIGGEFIVDRVDDD